MTDDEAEIDRITNQLIDQAQVRNDNTFSPSIRTGIVMGVHQGYHGLRQGRMAEVESDLHRALGLLHHASVGTPEEHDVARRLLTKYKLIKGGE